LRGTPSTPEKLSPQSGLGESRNPPFKRFGQILKVRLKRDGGLRACAAHPPYGVGDGFDRVYLEL